jgi:hypothetical protein
VSRVRAPDRAVEITVFADNRGCGDGGFFCPKALKTLGLCWLGVERDKKSKSKKSFLKILNIAAKMVANWSPEK